MTMARLQWHDLQHCLKRTPAEVVKMMKLHGASVFCAGGFIRSIITGEYISDMDLFTPSKDVATVMAKELHKDVGGEKHKWFETDNAYTVKVRKMPVQFIHRWAFDQPETCLASFDYTIAQAAFWYDLKDHEWKSMVSERFYADLAGKRLVYLSPERNEDAGGSLLRVLKFYQRGYRIPLDSFAATMARLMMAVDFTKINHSAADRERQLAKVLCGLLREVDPNAAVDHTAYLAPEPGSLEAELEDGGEAAGAAAGWDGF